MKERPGCAYDAAGDQRRTSALKQRIRNLETEVDDLKDIIMGIGSTADENAAVTLARQLATARFRATADVAHTLRTDDDVHAALGVNAASNQTFNPAKHAPKVTVDDASVASPSSVATADSLEFDTSGKKASPSWMPDVTQVNPGLCQEEVNDVPIEVSTWLSFANKQLAQGCVSVTQLPFTA